MSGRDNLRPFKPGPDPRRGHGPPKGQGGKPPDEFKRICQHLASRAETIATVTEILGDPKHPAYLGALKWATEQGYGKAEQPVAHKGEVTHRVVIEVAGE